MTSGLLQKSLPRPGQVKEWINPALKILLLCDTENFLVKRVRNELTARKIVTETETVTSPDTMMTATRLHKPDLIVCPFLTKRIPEALYNDRNRPCLIVHPGISGDRGASSLDWAILEKMPFWGVTVLQASEVFDSGDIWSTSEFTVPDNCTKTGLYVGEVSDHAVDCVLDAVSRYSQNIAPVPLDYSSDEIKGNLKRNMKRSDREIDWSMPAEEIVRRIRMSDTQPGAIANLTVNEMEINMRLFDAHEETGETSIALKIMMERSKPGKLLGQKDGAVLVKAGDSNAVWIGQMKKHFKVPAVTELKNQSTIRLPPELNFPCAFEEIRIEHRGPVCLVYFDFYNGAMDQYQASRLEKVLKDLGKQDCKVVALMGGERFFSTGIHLCAIENSQNKSKEAMANINKINDVILALSELRDKVTVAVRRGNAGAGGEMMSLSCDRVLAHPVGIHLCAIENSQNKSKEAMANINKINDVILALSELRDKVTVAVLRGNAGAGGEMMSLSCDRVLAHPSVLVTPTYKSMCLHGSEYWTYFLPRKVGPTMAERLVQNDVTFSAEHAQRIGLIDELIVRERRFCKESVTDYCHQLVYSGTAERIINEKLKSRNAQWYQTLHRHRDQELREMAKNFQDEKFLKAMKAFVYHIKDDERPQIRGKKYK